MSPKMATSVLRRVVFNCSRLNASNYAVSRIKCLIFDRFHSRTISASSVAFSGRKYTDKHEWVLVSGPIGTVGISDHAQESLGDVVFVQLPEVGIRLAQHDECGVIESVKAASEVYSPVSGKVTEINTKLEDKPALINKSCYEEGWLFKLELTKPEEVDALMDEKAYKEFLTTIEA